MWGEALGPGTPSVGLGPSVPRAQGLPAPLLLCRNLILKMVVLGLLCYQWLGRRVVCSTEVSAAVQGRALCGSVRGAHGVHMSRLGCAIWTIPCPGSVGRSQGCSPSTSRVRGLAAEGLPDGTAGTIGSLPGRGGDSQTGAPQTRGAWGKGCRGGKGPTAPCVPWGPQKSRGGGETLLHA